MGEMVEFPGVDRRRTRKPLWRNVLGEVLRGERLEQERILTEVAATAGVSPQYLSEVERGRKEASSEIVAAVCDSLGIGLADLLAEVGRDLTVHRAPVLRLDTARLRRAAQAPRGTRSGDVVLLAA
jgi:transcriptional regulator with XRE-family HTH domain